VVSLQELHEGGAVVPHIFAYLDAGTGSMIIQAVIAGLVAVPIVFRRQVGNGVRAVRRLTGRSREQDVGSTASSPATRDTSSR
jgi:hypothetical protein